MELTPQLLTDEIDFRIAVRGYDRHEVDDFLERVAVAVGQLQSQLTKAVARARSAEARLAEIEAGGATTATEAHPGDAAEVAAREAEESTAEEAGSGPVPKAPPSAPVPVIGGDDALNEELRRTLVLAQRTADTAIREAHDEAREILEQANDEARRNREAAEAAHAKAREEAHGRLVAEIRELEATRESMRSDTVVLERHLGTERARVRETIQVLRRLVEDPESFRTAPTPELSGATTPAALGPAPTATDPPAAEPTADEAPSADVSGADVPSADVSGADAPSADVPGGAARARGQAGAPDDAAGADGPDVGATDGHDVADGATDDGPAVAATDTGTSRGGAEDPATGQPTATGATAEEDQQQTAADERSDDDGPTGSEPAAEGDDADSARLGQLFGSAESTRDWRSTGPGRGDQGPHTQPVAAARFEEESDEAFLAELRRAMSDDEPLGPSETDR